MGRTRRTLLALCAAVLAVPLAGAVPAYADATTGSISGQLSTAGVVRTDVWASLYTSTAGWRGATRVDETGTFHFTDLAPGDYQVQFLWNDTLVQWYRSKPLNATPDTVTVVAGQDTVVDDSTLPTGTISGTLTDADGNPMPQVEAYASPVDGGGSAAYGFTDANGHYTIEALTADYQLSFTPTGYQTDYVPHSASPTGASVFTVTAGQALTIDERLPATGSISGRYTTAGGEPVARAYVDLLTADGYGGGSSVQTGDDGTYQLPHVYVGSYKVQFINPNFTNSQYATGKLTIDAADVFTVAAGADTVVNDSQLPVGTITVTATDSVSHQPIADFCAGADGQQACSNGSGTATVTNVRQGNQSLYVYTQDTHYFGINDQPVTIAGGADVSVAVSLRPGATIDTVVTDAATGAPVPYACVGPFSGSPTMIPDATPYCGDAQGTVHIGPLDPGSYALYVRPPAPYGYQFVGVSGGVGSPEEARRTTVTVGATVTLPPIKLDHAGTIAGTVTDGSGHPLSGALVTTSAFEPGPGPTGAGAQTDSAGHYTLSGLGPYQWPLLFVANNLPEQWSGGVPDRTRAGTVCVVSDATVTYNEKMVAGITVSGTVLAGGAPAGSGRVIAYNTVNGEVTGAAELDGQGSYHLQVLGSQTIRLRFENYVPGGPQGWFGGADYAHAKSVDLHKKDVKLNLTVG